MATPLEHIDASLFAENKAFKSTASGKKKPIPMRDRVPHGQRLLSQLAALRAHGDELNERRALLGLQSGLGLVVTIEIRPKSVFDFQNLEWKRDGIEVLNVRTTEVSDVLSVYVPDGRLGAFEKRVHQYLERTTKKGDPKNATLINAIEAFRISVFEEMWTDDGVPPEDGSPQWFQVWLRLSCESAQLVRNRFANVAAMFGIEVENGYVPFPGRAVVAVHATRNALQTALDLLDMVAEIRAVRPTTEFFLSELKPFEQSAWVKDLLARTTSSQSNEAPYVTLVDTGVAQGHPLIAPSLTPSDQYSIHGSWSVNDNAGHGTQMAGVVLYGNLTEALSSSDSVTIDYRLESVKILPDAGQNPHHLYGWTTQRATELVEEAAPKRRRLYAMMTTCVGSTTGVPSEWSATIDRLSFGSGGSTSKLDDGLSGRLFVLAAGNIPWTKWIHYPYANALETVESPAESWNALSVGAVTDLTQFDTSKWPSLKAIATAGDLSPCSSTSLLWHRSWPIKPDVVAEGGNGCLDGATPIVGPESLRLLTTCHDQSVSLLSETGDTSAAAAAVARLCALVFVKYPDYWPETVRALIVHGARHTSRMLMGLPSSPTVAQKEEVLRRFGFGAIDAERTLSSRVDRPTLVIQRTLKPFRAVGSDIRLSSIAVHDLPWPAVELASLGATKIQLRVTLSYFVEPNPSRRGWMGKFRYQSHGLRFAVKAASESEDVFAQRVNLIDRQEAAGFGPTESMEDPDSAGWNLGTRLRSRGSITSDTWTGTAVDLASKSQIVVFPTGGWWKDWTDAKRDGVSVRYALVISLSAAESLAIDLYNPIKSQVDILTPIET